MIFIIKIKIIINSLLKLDIFARGHIEIFPFEFRIVFQTFYIS